MQDLTFNFTNTKKEIGNLQGVSLAFTISNIAKNYKKPILIICKDNFLATKLSSQLPYTCIKSAVYNFNDYETLPYESLSPHQEIISNRISLLSKISSLNEGIVVSSITTIMQRLCPKDYILKNSFILKKGDIKNIKEMKDNFIDVGYMQVSQVFSPGEFAMRGSILDIFPIGAKNPYRIDFFDDEVDTISTFDIENQCSIEKIDEIKLLPAHEFPLDSDGIALFRNNYRENYPNANLKEHSIYQSISKNSLPSGIEYYLPLFFTNTSSFFDYLNENFAIIFVDDVKKAIDDFYLDVETRYQKQKGDISKPALAPHKVFLNKEDFINASKKFLSISLFSYPLSDIEKRGVNNTNTLKVDDIAFNAKLKNSATNLINFVHSYIKKGFRLLISSPSEGRYQNLKDIFPRELIDTYKLKSVSNLNEFLDEKHPLCITIAPFDEGIILPKSKLIFLTESELYGTKVIKQRENSRKSQIAQDAIIKNLVQLNIDQLVVHLDHGIGKYKGLKKIKINDVVGEYITIEYQDGDTLNIPITSLNKIARYSGAENPTLSKLGSDKWNKNKAKAQSKVRDVAAMLLDLYATRKAYEGIAFNVDKHALNEFSQGFLYEETADQLQAINATLLDMQSKKPMDRLICGDVGFGKTEVALRAAFVAANDGYQVAILVPTTVLAEQHYNNFKDRFANTAINVDYVSRFKTTKEQNEALKKVENGEIDIIIGTHKLLSHNIKFKKLGLLIVDEEHRFGVKQKERLKALKSNVDILTLTATPIPRTLSMAMDGIRTLSIIATPPESRLAVKTFVQEREDNVVREAIMRELRRGGQVYYLHNDVATIKHKYEELEKLVPEAKILIAHGQMHERELQKAMRDFNLQKFNILLCSTIVENGLDVPTANTIIIDRADLLGLAQLHQIRGRVGRSNHQAYAYLFTPPKDLISKDAIKRLDVLANLDNLGAGFILANHDLEIRGAGELLGEEQSGQINTIGFSLYSELLNVTVKALKEGREPTLLELSLDECDINLNISALIPDEYVGDINTRLTLYKRLASCTTDSEFENLKIEFIDRFGKLPDETINLFLISKLKKMASKLGISRIVADKDGGVIEFYDHHKVNIDYLVTLITKCKHNEYKMTRKNALRYNIPESKNRNRIELLEKILESLYLHSSLNKTSK